MNADPLTVLEEQSRRAVGCSLCFSEPGIGDAKTVAARPTNRPNDVALAPYVGADYWSAESRVAVMMLNPGHASADHKLARRDLGHALRDGGIGYTEYNKELERLMPKWGFGAVLRWLKAVGLEHHRIAFMNMALCAVNNDDYFPDLFRTCFHHHTCGFLQTLHPDVVLLCGKAQLKPYVPMIESLGFRTILTWHYRPMNTGRGRAEIDRVRNELSIDNR